MCHPNGALYSNKLMSHLLATSYSLLQPSFSNRIVDSCYNVITVNVHEQNIRRH